MASRDPGVWFHEQLHKVIRDISVGIVGRRQGMHALQHTLDLGRVDHLEGFFKR